MDAWVQEDVGGGEVHPMLVSIRTWLRRATSANPIIRRSDRIEALAYALALLVVALAVPLCVDVGKAVNQVRERTVITQDGSRHSVQAVAVADSVAPGKYPTEQSVQVRWMADTTPHTESVPVDHPVKAGEPLKVWVDAHGKLTPPPVEPSGGPAEAVGTGIGLWLFIAAATLALALAAHVALDRHRRRGWDHALEILIRNDGGRANRTS
jgi:hypothetical protein